MRADKKLAAATLASLALFGAQEAVQAKAVMVPFIAVGGGWQTLVSYVNDLTGGTTLRIAYSIKPALTTGACLHTDAYVRTSPNDLTSFIVDGAAQSPAPIYADTIGGTHAPVTGPTTFVGFMAVENTTLAETTLAVETISFHAGMRFLYAQRSIDLNHTALGVAVAHTTSALLTTHTTKFMSFAPIDSRPHVYAVGVTTAAATGNVFATNYNAPISLIKTNGYYWDRLENQYSDDARLSDRCVTLQPVCAPASAPAAGLISLLNCQAGTIFARVGGWFHLANDATAANLNVIVFKVESNPAFGFAVTPLHPLLYTTQ